MTRVLRLLIASTVFFCTTSAIAMIILSSSRVDFDVVDVMILGGAINAAGALVSFVLLAAAAVCALIYLVARKLLS